MPSSTGGESVVLDSSVVVAHHNVRDVHHESATEIIGQIAEGRWGHALLLEYVVLEVATVLLARRGHDVAARVVNVLLGAREVDFVPCSDFFPGSLDVFLRQSKGSLSFADAAIVHVARTRPATRVATFDGDLAGVDGVALVPV